MLYEVITQDELNQALTLPQNKGFTEYIVAAGNGVLPEDVPEGRYAIARITSYNVCYTKLLRFPNPVGSSATISFNLSKEHYYDVKTLHIYDLSGRKVRTIENINSNSTFMDITGFLEGIYTLQLVTQDGSVLTGKMMVK